MPRIFEEITYLIPPGEGTEVNWGPNFGDPSDGTSWFATTTTDLEALALSGNLTAIGTVILSALINANFSLGCIGQTLIQLIHANYPSKLIAQGQVAGNLSPTYNLLTALGTITGQLGPTYSLTSQDIVDLEAIALNYPSKLTAQGAVASNELLTYNLLTAIGTVAFNLGITGSLTCQGLYDLESLALAHTKNCNCAPRITAVAVTFTGPHTCQTSIANLIYQLDFTGAATGVAVNVTTPTGATSMFSEVWSGGGGGGTALINGGGGGGGGGYASDTEPVVAGNIIAVTVGAGGAVAAAGGLSLVTEDGTTRARATGGGAGGNGGAGGQGGAGTAGDATNGDTLRDGGAGGGGGGVQLNGGGGGGGSGTANAGTAGAANRTAGTGGSQLGGNGGIGGGGVGAPSAVGNERGGGGGGASTTNGASAGARGGARVQFTIPTP